MTKFVDEIIRRIRMLFPEGSIPLHAPLFVGNERDYLLDCIETTYVSSVGPYVKRFEAQIENFLGVKHAVAVSTGTAALELSLRVVDVKPRDEVLIPALTFVATANAVSYLGAIPHLVDSDEKTLGIDPYALRSWLEHISERSQGFYRNKFTGNRLKALVPMHTFGHLCDMDLLVGVANDYRLELIEDAAEALGSSYRDNYAGTIGSLGAFSFNGNKIITTGGGGMVVTNNQVLADRVRHISTTAKVDHPWRYFHDEIGYNYRMPNINAALGCAQLDNISGFLASKRKLTKDYQEVFVGLQGLRIFEEPEQGSSNYWLQTLVLSEDMSFFRDEIITEANSQGLSLRPCWSLLHTLPPYMSAPRAELPVAESLERRIINLPSSANLQ